MKSKTISKISSLILSINAFVYSSNVVKGVNTSKSVQNVNSNINTNLSNSQSNIDDAKKSRVSRVISSILNKYGGTMSTWLLKKMLITGLSTIVGPIAADIMVETVVTEWNNRKKLK